MSEDLPSGTVAVVVGATSGIGRASALLLAERGAVVALVGRRAHRLEAVDSAIKASGGRSMPVKADIRVRAQVVEGMAQIVEALGRIDVLVNSAGVMSVGNLADQLAIDLDDVVQTNLMGLVHCCQAALPHLMAAARDSPRQVADLVMVSSIAAFAPLGGRAVYGSTKSAVSSLCESLRQEVSPAGVRICVIEPGAVRTELADRISDAERALMPSLFDSPHLLRAQDVAEMVRVAISQPKHVALNRIVMRNPSQIR